VTIGNIIGGLFVAGVYYLGRLRSKYINQVRSSREIFQLLFVCSGSFLLTNIRDKKIKSK